MTAFASHLGFEFKTGLRNPAQLLMNYLFPLAFYAIMGLVMTQINPLFKDNMIPAMIVLAAMASCVLGLPGPTVQAREAGVFRSFKINGVPALSIVAIPVLTAMLHTTIVAAIITFTAAPAFGGALPINWGNLALVTLLTAFACGAIGALIGVIAGSSQSTVLWSQLVFLPSMLLGGLMMPVDALPESVRHISALLPATHAMQAYLGLAFGQQTAVAPATSVIVLLAGGVLAFGMAIFLFSWDSQNSSRRGHPMMALLALAPYVAGSLVG